MYADNTSASSSLPTGVNNIMELDTNSACPNELINQLRSVRTTRGGVVDEELNVLLQRLHEASLQGDTVYTATFYFVFTDDGVVVNNGIMPRNMFAFERLRGTAFIFRNGVGWQLQNVDQPMLSTRLDSAVAQLRGEIRPGSYGIIDRDAITNRTIAPGASVHLNTIGNNWFEGSLQVTENWLNFRGVSVTSPWF